MTVKQLNRPKEACIAFDQAVALASTPGEAAHIRTQIDSLSA
jgi:RNA polymerase sigma-70 factor (ECF subfamily)